MSYSFVANISFKSDTYGGAQRFSSPLLLDQGRYNYFIKILNVRFSNNIKNVANPLTLSINGTVVFTLQEGIYEIADIISLVNGAQSSITLELNNNNGHIQIKNNGGTALTLGGSLLASIQMGSFSTPLSLAGSGSIASPNIAAVSDYNFFKLQSDSIGVSSFETSSDVLNYTNTLYTFSSAIGAFGFKDYVAFEPILYPITADQLNEIDFRLTDEFGNELKLLSGAKSDFSIQCVIVKADKH